MIELHIDKFLDLMINKELQLPKRWQGSDFKDSLNDHFNKYVSLLEPNIKPSELEIIKEICNWIIDTIDLYHAGYPTEAYTSFKKVMRNLMKNPLKIYSKNAYQGEFAAGRDPLKLYRLRNINTHGTLERKDIFHVPYSMRSKIATTRYSISGFPSLYLATELNLCINETSINSFSDIRIASKFELVRNRELSNLVINVIEMGIKPVNFIDYHIYWLGEDSRSYIDFTDSQLNAIKRKDRYMTRYFNEIDLHNPKTRSDYLLWYPLISSCSFIRHNKSDYFASEYIVPQLLMQWIRTQSNANKLYGIRYFSCASYLASEKGFNYVFPASGQRLNDTFFCSILSKAFKLTKPVYLHEFGSVESCEDYLSENSELEYVMT